MPSRSLLAPMLLLTLAGCASTSEAPQRIEDITIHVDGMT